MRIKWDFVRVHVQNNNMVHLVEKIGQTRKLTVRHAHLVVHAYIFPELDGQVDHIHRRLNQRLSVCNALARDKHDDLSQGLEGCVCEGPEQLALLGGPFS